MHILFLHQNFPAQFRYIAPRLAHDHGWRVTFVTERPQGEIPGVEKIVYRAKYGATQANHYYTRNFENAVGQATAVYDVLKQRPDIQPDLVVAHSGFGSSLFLPHLYDAPIINFFEYYYRSIGGDLGYRRELPVNEAQLLRLKTKNAMIMLDLDNCTRGWSPTNYQRDVFPVEYRSKIDVIFDGIDGDAFQRRENPKREIAGLGAIPAKTRVITYVARGFEMMRGFDIFMKAAKRIYEQYPDVLFLVVGTDRVHYGGDLSYIETTSFREHVLKTGDYDMSKFRFTGYVPQETLSEILSLSDLHMYLTQPFITSWSMIDAMACGAVVLASDQVCVREYLTHGRNGLLCDFFDIEGMARQAVEVLRDPASFRHLGTAARQAVDEKYAVAATLPRLKRFYEQVAAKRREPSLRTEALLHHHEAEANRREARRAA